MTSIVPTLLLFLLTGAMPGGTPAESASASTSPSPSPAPEAPSFREVLEQAGLARDDLAVGAEPDFLGHPPLSAVPFLLPHVEGARRDPLRLVALGRNLSATARQVTGISGAEDPEDGPSRILPALTAFLLQPRLPAGFRGFPPPPASSSSIPLSMDSLPMETAEGTELPAPLRAVVTELVEEALRAAELVERSWRRVPRETVAAAVSAREVPRLAPGGSVPWAAIEDAARDGDDVDRAGAFARLAVAAEKAVRELTARPPSPGFDRWEVKTARGRVIVAGSGDHVHVCRDDCLLVIDLGGRDVYRGTVGGARFPGQPVSVALDLGGDDRYRARIDGSDDPGSPAQGAGLGGVGLLVDAAGNDLYEAGDGAQGFGLLGYGLLWDRSGGDRYEARGGAQGSAVFGGGLLVDEAGGDEYRVLGEGQGYGGSGGAGALVDLTGDDAYSAEPDPAVATGRADYHSGGRVAANFSQGAGAGRRGGLSDGRAWAGGLGVLADLAGDDAYTAGNFAQGLGFWFGTGLLLDSGGDDVYRSVYFSQGAGAHFSLALLLDREGNDRHLLHHEAAASLGYGWDFAASVLVDGGGDDLYRASNTALGVAELSSVALFLELGGDDEYRVPAPDGRGRRTFGAVDGNPRGRRPGEPLRAAAGAHLVGLFVDLGGEDRYELDEKAAAGNDVQTVGRPGGPGDRSTWIWTGAASGETSGTRRGVGLDLELPSAPSPLRDPPSWLLDLPPR